MAYRRARRARNRHPNPQQGMSSQNSSSIGLVTTATILALGVAAAYFTITLDLQGNPNTEAHPFLLPLATFSAVVSLLTYPVTATLGMTVLNHHSPTHKTRELRRTTVSLYLQTVFAAAFAILSIFS